MPSNLLRAALLALALSSLALIGGPIASASAEVESSHITSPADPTNVFYDKTVESPESVAFTVAGTTTGEGEVDIRCYFMRKAKSEGSMLIAEKVKPVGHAFSVNVQTKSLDTGQPCVLRAVPAGDKNPQPPGLSTDPFQGPRISASEFEVFVNEKSKLEYDYEFEGNVLSGYMDVESVGDCGLDYSNLVAPSTLEESPGLFDCDAALYSEDDPPSGPRTRSELQIDGANAYGPTTADYVNQRINEELESKKEPTVVVPGAPQVAVTKTFDPLSGLATVHEVDPIVKCSPASTVPPTASSCASFVSTGVQLERTWQLDDGDRVAAMTDSWRSSNGSAHALNALYDEETVNDNTTGGAYELPGTGTFGALTKGQLVTLPATGANAIYMKEDSATPDAGDGEHPQGAIVYDMPPANGGPVGVYRGTEAKEGDTGFELPYQGTIPGSGSYTLRMTFIQAYALTEAQALVASAISGYAPTLTIAAPASGTTVSSPSVAVAGTAGDTGALSSLTVNGSAVAGGAGGAWSTNVALKPGAQTITAVATDEAGLSTTRSIAVTYAPPPPAVAKAAQVGNVSAANGRVTFTVACNGPAGTSCELQAALSTVEKTRGGKLVAVSARRGRKTRSKQLTVGSAKLTIPAGRRATLAIVLSPTGKRLLARFKRLPVHLSVVLVSAGRRSTVIAQNLTVKPPRRARGKAPHRRR